MENFSIEQIELIQKLKQEIPALTNLSNEEILSIYNENLSEIRLNEDEQISIMGFNITERKQNESTALPPKPTENNNTLFLNLVKTFTTLGIATLTLLVTKRIRNQKKIIPNYWVKNETFFVNEIDKTVVNITKHYTKRKKRIEKYINKFHFKDLGEFSARIKSDYSLRDKIKSYLKKHPSATHKDVWDEIRDCFGFRTVIEPKDYTNHPEVKKLIDAGDMKGAMIKASELQSQPAVDKIKQVILANKNGDNSISVARISNYVSKDGIPYFSEAQLADLKQFGIDNGVEIDYVKKALPNDPKAAQMDFDADPTTRSQPSGYTALQMNFVTKDGDTIEWQFRGKDVDRFAEGEHIPYDLRTGKDITGGNKDLETLYAGFKDMLEGMDPDVYKAYNKYLDAHYTHLRKLELGFETTPPKLQDFAPEGVVFSDKLEAENLIKISKIAHDLKDGKISLEVALEQYNNI